MPLEDPQYISVVIIGGGQAGLSASYCLRQRGVDDHVILEKHEIGHAWRADRWDSFRLVTPNHQCRLPGFSYEGGEPEGFMAGKDVAEFVRGYAKKFRPPVLEDVTVTAITKREGYFHLTTNKGVWFCDDVIVAIGGHHAPFTPKGAEGIPGDVFQLHSSAYKRPVQLPDGPVVVVGSGHSGVQIAEDLHRSGREVHLCLGSAPWLPRTYRGKSTITWLEEMGWEGSEFSLRDDAHDADLRELAREGVKLHGFVEEIRSAGFSLSGDVAARLERAERFRDEVCGKIDAHIAGNGLGIPEERIRAVSWVPPLESSRLDFKEEGIASIIWCTGFQPDFRFIELPVLNMHGYPETERGVTEIPGLYFLGLPWMHGWGSARFAGIAEDADHVAARIQASIAAAAAFEA